MAKIVWCIPTYGDLDVDVYTSHLLAAIYTQKRHIDIVDIARTKKMHWVEARNKMAMAILSTQDATHAFWADADVKFPQHVVAELLRTNKPIVSGVYVQKAAPYYPNIYSKGKYSMKKGERGKFQFLGGFEDNKIFPIDGAGFGCVLIGREVFEKIKVPHFEWKKGENSEDLDFFLKAKEAGFQAYCNSAVLCEHLGDRESFGIKTHREYEEKMKLKDIHKLQVFKRGEDV